MLGVYVDNLQIVHSGDIDDESSKVSQFLRSIQEEWDVEDEGPMHDILGIEVIYRDNGTITLHQASYIDKLLRPARVPPRRGS